MESMIIGIPVAMWLVLIAVVVIARSRKRERLRRIAGWATAHGWSIAQDPAVGWTRQLPARPGRVPLLVHTRLGDLTVCVAEYTYTTVTSSPSPNGTSTTTTTTHALLVTAVRLPHRYPAIAVVGRRALSRWGRAMFGDDAAATGHAEFDRRFRIRTRHPDIARTVVGPTLIAEHLAGSVPTWSLADQDLLTWQQGRITDPEQIPVLIEPMLRVAHLLAPPSR
ncbi:hypothetical protein [Pseudonocardia sp. DLS-67]